MESARVRPIVAVTIALLLPCCQSPLNAKQVSRLWYFGANIGFHTTDDSVENNAALAGDPRPDSFQNREMSVEDGMSYSVTAGYGMSRFLSLQLEVGYFKGDVGEVDVYLEDTFPVVSPSNPTTVTRFNTRETTIPVTAGELTQVPLTLSAVLRFRPAATVNPWISAGFGRVFTQVAEDPDVGRVNARMNGLRIRAVADEFGDDLTPYGNPDDHAEIGVPMKHPVSIDVEDANEWHVAVGFDYFISDRVSLTTDVRYVSVDQDVVVDLKDQDQVVFLTWSEKLFRKDRSLVFFSSDALPPNPIRVPQNPELPFRYDCTLGTTGDYDNNGNADICYKWSDFSKPEGMFVVQGGEIDLSGFSFSIGLRVHL